MKNKHRLLSGLVASLGIGAMAIALSGCGDQYLMQPPKQPQPYVDKGYKPDLPEYLRGTIYERTETSALDPFPVTGYSLCVNLQGTGENANLPSAVRDMLIKRMTLSGFGEYNNPEFTHVEPEMVLRDKRVAVVQVIGLLPVGARKGQQFDVVVRAMPNSHTTSLSHGHLYNTELRERGLELPANGGLIQAYADAGDVFVNPVYALEGSTGSHEHATVGQITASLRFGVVMNSGRATEDRPIQVALRVPQASIARAIESRINTRIPQEEGDRQTASAQDEGLVDVYVPISYRGDWWHLINLVNHLYLNSAPDVLARKVRMLMNDAHQPNAQLSDISFCLEGLGPTFVPYYQGMLNDPDPAVEFCAARAAACCGDPQGLDALTRLATDSENPMQLAAVHAMGELPPSPMIDKRLETALGSNKQLVRIEAYKILADHGSRRIIVEETPCGFELDIVDYPGTPLVYASRTGPARIAVFGRTAQITPPIIFSAMRDRFMISSDDSDPNLTIFYRDPNVRDPIKVTSGTSLPEVIARLGGKGAADQVNLQFGYPDVVAIVQALSDGHFLTGSDDHGQMTSAPMVVDAGDRPIEILAAASLETRPQASGLATTGRPIATIAGTDSPIPSSAGTSNVPSFGSPDSTSVNPSSGSSIPAFNRP